MNITITRSYNTLWVRYGMQTTAIDGTDFPDGKAWKSAVLAEIETALGNLDLEE